MSTSFLFFSPNVPTEDNHLRFIHRLYLRSVRKGRLVIGKWIICLCSEGTFLLLLGVQFFIVLYQNHFNHSNHF